MLKKYKMTLTIIIVLVVSLLLLSGGYLIYRYNKNKNNAVVIVDDKLSINYLNGNKFKFKSKKKEIPFSLINDSDEQILYNIKLENVSVDGKKVTYDLYENDKKIINGSKLSNNKSLKVSDYISINNEETKSYKLVVNNPSRAKISFELKVSKVSEEDRSFAQVILNDNTINKETKTKVGEEIAVADEGLILDVDDSGNTYYFRGSVANNYFQFANKMWRIVRVNGNGTVRVILDSDIGTSVMYDSTISSDRLNSIKNILNLSSYLTLDRWYNENLKDYDEYIASERFCVDTNQEGENLSNYFRVNLSNIPTFNCLGTKNNVKIGLLTIDEAIYAGATVDGINSNYYLYNPEITNAQWTLSPAKDGYEGIYFYELGNNGSIAFSSTGESTKGLRPVINIEKNVEVLGEGTKDNPYTIK